MIICDQEINHCDKHINSILLELELLWKTQIAHYKQCNQCKYSS